MIVHSTIGYEILSFMDGFYGYNKIRINDDQHKTTFVTPWGIFCWIVMNFGLNNVGATYQKGMVGMFHDMIHDFVEVYVDDILAKYREKDYHFLD